MNNWLRRLRELLPAALLIVVCSGLTMAQATDRLATTPAALIVAIDAGGNVSMNETQFGTVRDTQMLTVRLKEIFATRTKNLVFADRDGATQTQIPLDQRIAKGVYVHADQSMQVADLLKFLTELRETKASPINLTMNRGDIAHQIRVEGLAPDYMAVASSTPDPFLLRVQLAADKSVSLNGAQQASLEALSERIRGIFADRRAHRDFIPGTNQVPQVVRLQFDPRLKVGDTLDLVQAVAFTYASPIYLRLETPEQVFNEPTPPSAPARTTRRRTRRP
jgi:biopolymer transport protein ExbD